jgi:TusE/DsrC/DsvC family sulfur relay protein
MTTDTIGGIEVELDDEGFLVDPSRWTEAMVVPLARRAGIEALTERHWLVIRFMRAEYEAKGYGPSVRGLAKASGISIKELYELFPRGPAKTAAMIAGIPKPHGCI